ncbi:tetratricopeptide repeat protein [Nonlabens xylanidelens]|uniref:Tetratricopeptide repeat protein n=1 Tax=Nonlabens xylanidelens TaxID=191564 RepID=A0A2S6IR37_9FLAO|nr:LytTR family transcriptional regulator [Nonlabens xylanidelens]PPK96600.1 tetratricopeptide repeat protein [Nonlabens xylanidelens]PQJ13319.1 hypothetical protein BST94_13200 [Nonlabens xylanidelens]
MFISNNTKRVTLFLLCFFSTLICYSQQDLINNYVRKARGNFGKQDSLKHYGNLLIAIKDSSAQAQGYLFNAHAMRTVNKVDSAIYYSSKANNLVPNKGLRLKTRVINFTTSCFLATRKFELALKEATLLEQIALKMKDERQLAAALSLKARAQDGLGDFEKAMKNIVKAVNIQEKVDSRPLANMYTQIAITYNHMNQPALSLPWFKKSLEQAVKNKNVRSELNAINNLASHYHLLKNIDSSKFYYSKLLQKENQLNPFQKMGAYLSLARINVDMGEVDKAIKHLELAKTLNLPNIKNSNTAISFLSIEQKIARKKEDFELAEVFIDSIMSITNNGELNQINYPFLLEKATLYEEKKEYEKAFKTLNKYTVFKDSIDNNTNLAIIQNSADFYQLEEKEEDLLIALTENESSQNTIIWLSIIGILIIIALLFLFKRYRNSKIREKELEKKHKEILVSFEKLQEQIIDNKKPNAPDHILLNSKHIVKLDQLEYVKSEGHYLDYFIEGTSLPLTERSALKERINQLETSGFLQVHRSYVINIKKVKTIHSALVIMETGNKIPLSRTFKQRLKEEDHPLFT